MSYDITIGEASIEQFYADETTKLTVHVKGMTHPEAPVFLGDKMTRNGNGRHPGYSQWAHFCRETNLYELFFVEETGLMSQHPGYFGLKQSHLDIVSSALEKWEQSCPGKIPGWDPDIGFFDDAKKADPKYDGNLARLMWLEWWIKWALTNCKMPAICNR